MSIQIAVRLDEELVGFVDSLVRDGDAASRAEVVTRALRREQRERRAAQDAAIYAAGAPDDGDEFTAMRAATAHRQLDID